MAAPRRRIRRDEAIEDEPEEVAPRGRGARGRGGRRVAAKGPPVGALALGGAAVLLLVVLAILLFKGDDDGPGEGGATPAATSGPEAGGTVASGGGPGASDPASGAAPVAPQPPKLDAAKVRADLAAAATAAAAYALGESVRTELKDEALADACYEKALELDPDHGDARRRLDFRKVDPARDFPGLEEIQGSPQTYLLTEFLNLRNVEMSRPQREAQKARWLDRKRLVDARIEEAAGDPFIDRIDIQRNRMLTLPFFASFQYDVVESTRPYALFVELVGDTVTERDRRREAVEDGYRALLEAYDQSVHDYLWKLAPAQLPHDPTFIVFVLKDRESYERFFREFEGSSAPPGVRAHYTNREKWALTYSNELEDFSSPDFAEGVQVLLHELTHAWVDRLASMDGGLTFSIRACNTHWFNEGIAEYLSCHFMDRGTIQFQPWRTMRLAELGQRPPGVRIPLSRAFKISSNGELASEASLVARSQKSVDEARAIGICSSGFYADMSLFMFWVNYANDRKYKRLFEDYVRKELSGEGGGDVAERHFAEIFAIEDLEQVIDDFQKSIVSGKVVFKNTKLEVESR